MAGRSCRGDWRGAFYVKQTNGLYYASPFVCYLFVSVYKLSVVWNGRVVEIPNQFSQPF